MIKKLVMTSLLLITHSSLLWSDSFIDNMRGPVALEDTNPAPELSRWQQDRKPVTRDYVQQPPLIPHKIDTYKINRKFNKCLACHSWANYQKFGATKISQTHFEDRQKSVMANVAARRYFCTQCHVPQKNLSPLVDNTFKSIDLINAE